MSNLIGFYNSREARKTSPCVSRPDLVAARNAALHSPVPMFSAAPIDSRMKCFRPDGTCYAVLTPTRWRDLRSHSKLTAHLTRERESGVVIALQ